MVPIRGLSIDPILRVWHTKESIGPVCIYIDRCFLLKSLGNLHGQFQYTLRNPSQILQSTRKEAQLFQVPVGTTDAVRNKLLMWPGGCFRDLIKIRKHRVQRFDVSDMPSARNAKPHSRQCWSSSDGDMTVSKNFSFNSDSVLQNRASVEVEKNRYGTCDSYILFFVHAYFGLARPTKVCTCKVYCLSNCEIDNYPSI